MATKSTVTDLLTASAVSARCQLDLLRHLPDAEEDPRRTPLAPQYMTKNQI